MPRLSTAVEKYTHNGGTLVAAVTGEMGTRSMVFLHGWGGNRESLAGIGILFQHCCRVHLIDLPGFGEAPLPPDTWDTAHYADLVERYILDNISGPVILVGHSFGGRVSVRLAARASFPLDGLVLMSVPGLPGPAFSRNHVRRFSIRNLRKFLRAVQPLTGPGPLLWHTKKFASADYTNAGPLRSILVRVVNEDLTEKAKQIKCPTLLIWGTEDTDTRPRLAYGFRDLIQGSTRLELLPHMDHFLYSGTGAHLCGYKIREWLKARSGE